jgi:hypothetical protein
MISGDNVGKGGEARSFRAESVTNHAAVRLARTQLHLGARATSLQGGKGQKILPSWTADAGGLR